MVTPCSFGCLSDGIQCFCLMEPIYARMWAEMHIVQDSQNDASSSRFTRSTMQARSCRLCSMNAIAMQRCYQASVTKAPLTLDTPNAVSTYTVKGVPIRRLELRFRHCKSHHRKRKATDVGQHLFFVAVSYLASEREKGGILTREAESSRNLPNTL